ncbi:hypothetical protein F4692_002943 [Nocardioides cavernae]|uniref:Uncharacterized protein n=1 Tax=Nocardioides cavernae TaxID=1921566 RepID=A0A7Y9KSQ8_9ACTN|nr:hypothetical protein [Nocardioides cavernae]NYE37810.1 hypothetical protein [Nocardioides cavernae]
MTNLVGHLLVALAVTVVVGAVSGGGWAYFLTGAVLALSLWVMLFAGSYAGAPASRGRTSARQYAVAAVAAVALGWAMYVVGGGASWWAVGFIMAGAVVPATSAAVRGAGAEDRA